MKPRDTNHHKSTGMVLFRFQITYSQNMESYEKYWKFLPCRNNSWFNDVDKKTSRGIVVRLRQSRNLRSIQSSEVTLKLYPDVLEPLPGIEGIVSAC